MPKQFDFSPQFEIDYKDIILTEKLSEGGYGVVHKGLWKQTLVAIKQIKTEIIKDDKLDEF